MTLGRKNHRPIRFRLRAILLGLILLLLSPSGSSARQKGESVHEVSLESGRMLTRELGGGAAHSYRIRLRAGEFIRVRVLQEGIDLVLALFDGGGAKLVETDRSSRSRVPEELLWAARQEMDLRLEVRASDAQSPPGRYQLKLVERRGVAKLDEARLGAQQYLWIGNQLRGRQPFRVRPNTAVWYEQALKRWQEAGEEESAAYTGVLLGEASAAYNFDETRKALEHCQQALTYWRVTDNKPEQAHTLGLIGEINFDLNEMHKALGYYQQALSLFHEIGDQKRQATILTLMADIHRVLHEAQKANEHYQQALRLSSAIEDRRQEATTLMNIGKTYYALDEQRKALDCFQQALPLWRALDRKWEQADTLNEIGYILKVLGEEQKALEYFQQALSLWRALDDKSDEGETFANIGDIYHALNERSKALEYYQQALPLFRATEDERLQTRALAAIARVYYDLGESQKALEYLKQPLSLWRHGADESEEFDTLTFIGGHFKLLCGIGVHNPARLPVSLQLAMPLWRDLGEKSSQAKWLSLIGKLYSDLGEKQKALEYYELALPLSKAAGDHRASKPVN